MARNETHLISCETRQRQDENADLPTLRNHSLRLTSTIFSHQSKAKSWLSQAGGRTLAALDTEVHSVRFLRFALIRLSGADEKLRPSDVTRVSGKTRKCRLESGNLHLDELGAGGSLFRESCGQAFE